MRILKATGQYFQSYQSIEFDYSNLGLALISGHTKAGKSTALDLPCWILTGTTSKESAADDVRSWFAEGLTVGKLAVEAVNGTIWITRIRGARSSQNDLYYSLAEDGDPIRGKDATNTQKEIHELLGIDTELYINGSYLHQFSKADQFFISKAKDRRETLERIANLSLPINLSERSSEARKEAKKARDAASDARVKAEGKLEAARTSASQLEQSIEQWYVDHARRVESLETKVKSHIVEHARRVEAMQAKVAGHEVELARKVEAMEAKVEGFETDRARRIQAAQAKVDGYNSEKEARALKLADQLGVIEAMIVEPKEFEKQYNQVKQQLKALDQVEADLKAKRSELTICKTRIQGVQSEYAKLNKVTGTCPTCLGPADNEHRHARIEELEAEVLTLGDELSALEPAVAALEESLALKPSLQDSFQKITRKQSENAAYMDKAETLRAQAQVLRLETNPYLGEFERIGLEGNPYVDQLERVKLESNPYLDQLEKVKAETNPYTDQLEKVKAEKNPLEAHRSTQLTGIEKLEENLLSATNELAEMDKKVSALTWLYDKSFELRGRLLEQSVKQLETKTNEYLERFFDAELRVRFTLEDSDKLEVAITNDGYDCPYRQLSGGERCLLKLAFSLNYMRAAEDKAGVKFNVLMLDEALNGLDPGLKVKAFTLLQSLENDYESILLIDHHEEFKNMFSKKFHVEKAGAFSEISAESDD